MNVFDFWKDVLNQDELAIRKYFSESAYINWHCTNEHFTVDEYIIANCEYPGEWDGVVERIEVAKDSLITITNVWLRDYSLSFHVTSFFKFLDNKIVSLDECWAEDGSAPNWRLEKHIGSSID